MNLENVKAKVIASDGKLQEAALTTREQAILGALDSALHSSSEFLIEIPDAILEHVESMRGIIETDDGRFYLRYKTGQNPLPIEFWGCVAKTPSIDWAMGYVRVTEENIAAEHARTSSPSGQEALLVMPAIPETPTTLSMNQDQTQVKKPQKPE
jgi:hypothetical protein